MKLHSGKYRIFVLSLVTKRILYLSQSFIANIKTVYYSKRYRYYFWILNILQCAKLNHCKKTWIDSCFILEIQVSNIKTHEKQGKSSQMPEAEAL